RVSTHPPLLRAVGRSTKFPRSAKVMFQPTHRSFERWDVPPSSPGAPRSCFNPPTAPSSGGTSNRLEARVMTFRFQPTHRSFERWDRQPRRRGGHQRLVSTHPPLLRAVRLSDGNHISIVSPVSTHPPLLRAVGPVDSPAPAASRSVSTHPPLLRAVG